MPTIFFGGSVLGVLIALIVTIICSITILPSHKRHKLKGFALFPDETVHTTPEGGLFVLGYLPERIDVTALCQRCIENKLAVVPGSAFAIDLSETPHSVRLNFSTPSEEDIVRGVKILGTYAKEYLLKKGITHAE
jgi:aspartate/methionine/tyrosine aminotransferase